MDPQYRRYGRWLKRAAWILAIYLFAAWLFMGLSPSQSISDPELVISQLRPFMLQAMILVFFIILQFGASVLMPDDGFARIYDSDQLRYNLFTNILTTW